ncbi:transcription termination/antitermination protein NusG [Shinella pollutisoli]|nr:transcription termination/antitermination NusG family protein [Shinella pollutisoli]
MQRNDWMGTPIGIPRDSSREQEVRLEMLLKAANRSKDRRWYAVRVWTGREIAVEDALVALGVETCLPMRMGPELRRRHRIIPPQPMPAIHGYVLVCMPPDGAVLGALRAIDYVVEVVGGLEHPMSLPDEEVMRFKALADAGLYDWQHEVQQRWRVGEKAGIGAGIFWGAACEILSCRSDGCGDAVVLISLLGKDVPVTVPLAILEKL